MAGRAVIPVRRARRFYAAMLLLVSVFLALSLIGLFIDEGALLGLRGLFIAGFAMLVGLIAGAFWSRS